MLKLRHDLATLIGDFGTSGQLEGTGMRRLVQTAHTRWAWTWRRALAGFVAVFEVLECTAAPDQAGLSAPLASLDQVIVVGTRVPTTVGQETESVSVITREEIERMGVANGADLLRQVVGVQVDQLGGPGGIGLAYIRGSDPNHVLVLVDGIRMNNATDSRGGGFDLSSIDPSEVERIEVLRGAASSIYGADAMGGVINIITRKGEPGGSASTAAGGLGYRAMNARTTLQAPGGSSLSMSTSTLRDGQDTKGGRLKLNQMALAGHAVIAPGRSVDVQLRHAERDSSTFPDDSGGIGLAVIRKLESRRSNRTSLGIRGVAGMQGWTLSLEGTGFEHQEDIDSPGVAPGVRSDLGIPAFSSATRYRRASALLSAVRHFGGGSELAVGGELLREHGTSSTVYELFGMQIPAEFDLRRDTSSPFIEYKWVPSRELIVRMGLRHDSVGNYGSFTSPSIGIRYSFSGLDGDLIGSFSEGFKPPSFFALGLPQVLGGNTMLRAERSKGLTFGFEKRLPGAVGEASMALFRRKYADLITFDNEVNQLVNADHVDVKGFELAVQVRVSASLRLQSHYTRIISYVVSSREPLRQRPGKRAGIEAAWQVAERARLIWRVEYAGDIFDSSVPTGNLFLPTYLRNDLVFAYAVNSKVTISAAIDNLANRDNQWYIGARSLGRRARVGLSLAF